MRIIYISNAIGEDCKKIRGIKTDSPAATKKSLDIASVIKNNKNEVVICSCGRGEVNWPYRYYKSFVSGKDPKIVYCSYLNFPVITHVVTLFSILFNVMKIMNRYKNDDFVLLSYNRKLHYLLAIIVSRILGHKCYLDLEDGAITNSKCTITKFIQSAYIWMFDLFCRSGAVLVSNKLLSQTSIKNCVVCHGVSKNKNIVKDWGGKLNVLYGGTIIPDTGSNMIIDLIGLVADDDFMRRNINIIITGKGYGVDAIKKIITGKNYNFIKVCGVLPNNEYLIVLRKSHIGLCLKNSSNAIGITTFPSKVIEYADYGLLVLTTPIDEVMGIFDNNAGALILDACESNELLLFLCNVVKNKSKYSQVAKNGSLKVAEYCSVENVRRDILGIING